VGVLGGTVFFAGLVAAKLGAAGITGRMGADGAARLACAAAILGNVLLALSPIYLGLAAGRLLAGIGLGLALVLGPVLARQAGGVRMVGTFGGSVMFGVAAALGAGSLMRGAGLDWRLDFVLATLVAILALTLLPATAGATVPSGSVLAIFRRATRRLAAWRLELLFTTALGVPYVLGVWLVPYLTTEIGLGAGAAGVLGVTLYVLTTLLRPEGARLDAEGRSTAALAGLAPIVAAAGLVLLAIAGDLALSLVSVVLIGVGFAIPYATMYDEAQELFPGARVAAVGLFSVGGNVLPLVVMPSVGAAIAAGHGEAALLGLAVVPLLAGLANLRPVAGGEGSGPPN
jgi:predicted MFS family arabinose efflux permease